MQSDNKYWQHTSDTPLFSSTSKLAIIDALLVVMAAISPSLLKWLFLRSSLPVGKRPHVFHDLLLLFTSISFTRRTFITFVFLRSRVLHYGYIVNGLLELGVSLLMALLEGRPWLVLKHNHSQRKLIDLKRMSAILFLSTFRIRDVVFGRT